MGVLTSWWTGIVSFVQATYHVNPYWFIFWYVLSIPIYWWGLFDIARGTYHAAKYRTLSEWRVILRGVVVNRLAWVMPYAYVMIVARELPWFIWAFLAVMIVCSSTYFGIQLNRGRLRDKLPRFLRQRVHPVEGTEDLGFAPEDALTDDESSADGVTERRPASDLKRNTSSS